MNNNPLLQAMISYYEGDPRRIQHFIKVYEFAKLIGEEEGLDKDTQLILETAAIVHDIGIKPAEEKYGSCQGHLQELEGPAAAEKMLMNLNYPKDVMLRVSYLVGHHHTYHPIDGMDYQILVEADFLVNLFEDQCSKSAIENTLQQIFKTKTGTQLCKTMFGIALTSPEA